MSTWREACLSRSTSSSVMFHESSFLFSREISLPWCRLFFRDHFTTTCILPPLARQPRTKLVPTRVQCPFGTLPHVCGLTRIVARRAPHRAHTGSGWPQSRRGRGGNNLWYASTLSEPRDKSIRTAGRGTATASGVLCTKHNSDRAGRHLPVDIRLRKGPRLLHEVASPDRMEQKRVL